MRLTVCILVLLVLLFGCVQVGAAVFVINGKSVEIATTVKDGKTYADPMALAKALGATITYDSAKRQFVVTGGIGAAVKGAGQLEGEWGEFGKAYTIFKENPLVFTLRDVEFARNPTVEMCEEELSPEAGNRFLILRYTLHNPQKDDYKVTGNAIFIRFTVIDADGKNYEHYNYAAVEADASDLDEVKLKPGQKVNAFTVVELPVKARVHKLIVEPHSDAAVLRYDLRERLGEDSDNKPSGDG